MSIYQREPHENARAHLKSLDTLPLRGTLLLCSFQPHRLLYLVPLLRTQVLFGPAQHTVHVLFMLLRQVSVICTVLAGSAASDPNIFCAMLRSRSASMRFLR